MADRFSELLAKGKDGSLTEPEREELVRFLNAPLLDPLTNPPAGFVSKHTFSPGALTARLFAIDWFSRCGQPISLDLTMEVEQIGMWPEAVESFGGVDWENVQLEAQNQLTMWLHQNARRRYQTWNEIVDAHKATIIEPLTRDRWVPFQDASGLDVQFIHGVQWDILGALMENSFFDTGHQCYFFFELLQVYEAGHFPCGWRGEWPGGSLVVY